MQLSIIIPTLNEEHNIVRLLKHLSRAPKIHEAEIIICDGQSEDQTREVVGHWKVKVVNCERGRAKQMNAGVERASSGILYFVHADTLPPLSFMEDIQQALDGGYDLGSYRFRFDSDKKLLKINNYFTRFNKMWTRGGDQSLFIRKDTFQALGGYQEEYVIMEEYDLLQRAKTAALNFKIMPKDIVVSARKYDENGYLKVQFANLVVFNMFRLGCRPQRILNMYRRLIDYRS
ncbi:MAG: TIGR04283 family arsenosugar biosynthesis glycosyltransferase [Saprospiraceae bacterium]|nr:TIGR04283 family arsenosugar biosynthesis glycosyltransferase [Saprospiraceae bacterium]